MAKTTKKTSSNLIILINWAKIGFLIKVLIYMMAKPNFIKNGEICDSLLFHKAFLGLFN